MGLQPLIEVRNAVNEVIRMHELNRELLEILLLMGYKISDFCHIHDITMFNNNFYSLLEKADSLIKEISSDLPQFVKHQKFPIRRKETPFKSDADEPEPHLGFCKVLVGCLFL